MARARMSRSLTVVVLIVVVLALTVPATAQEEAVDGQELYGLICAACHQPSGRGVSGTFPPLLDNPRIDDAAYVEETIRNGRTGVLEVNGVEYDGKMPAQNLTDAEISAVIDFVQNDLGIVSEATGQATGPGFPWGLVTLFIAVSALGVGLGYLLFTPGGETMTWGRSYGLAAIIFLFFVVGTVWFPSYLISDPSLRILPDLFVDLVASGAWLVVLVAGILGLRWLQKTDRI